MIAANVKAGMSFHCNCCEGQFPEDTAILDPQLGPVCKECNYRLKGAVAWMREIWGREFVFGEKGDLPIEQTPAAVRPVNTDDAINLPEKLKKRILS